MSLSRVLLAAAVWLALVLMLDASPARAQQVEFVPEAAAGADEAPGGRVTRRSEDESFLHWAARASGPIGVVILVMSIYLGALVVWMAIEYRRPVAVPANLLRDVSELLDQKRYNEAYNRLALDASFLARVLAAGVRRLPAGIPAAQRAMEVANEDVTMAMEHRTTYLATVGTLGPMIGLVGTVFGMILSFQEIATAGATPRAGELAAGISTALFATLEGILLSVPAIAFYAYFRNRIARLSLEVAMASEALLDQFAPGVRSPHPLAATVAGGRSALPPKGAE